MPTARQQAESELALAKKQLLSALSASEYAIKMVQYHQGRVQRLSRELETN